MKRWYIVVSGKTASVWIEEWSVWLFWLEDLVTYFCHFLPKWGVPVHMRFVNWSILSKHGKKIRSFNLDDKEYSRVLEYIGMEV